MKSLSVMEVHVSQRNNFQYFHFHWSSHLCEKTVVQMSNLPATILKLLCSRQVCRDSIYIPVLLSFQGKCNSWRHSAFPFLHRHSKFIQEMKEQAGWYVCQEQLSEGNKCEHESSGLQIKEYSWLSFRVNSKILYSHFVLRIHLFSEYSGIH